MRKAMTALAVLSACTALCAQARADEVYTLTGTYAGSTNPYVPAATVPFVAAFDLTDAQVETGAFTLFAQGVGYVDQGQATITGDVSGFNSLSIGGEQITPNYIRYGYLPTFNLTFDAAGDLTSVDAVYQGNSVDATISGTGAAAAATFGSDDPYLCGASYLVLGGKCTITGSFVHTGDPLPSPVPEPATFALLGAGLIGFGAVRRHLKT